MNAGNARRLGAGLCVALVAAGLPVLAGTAIADPPPTPTLTFTGAPASADPGTEFDIAPEVTVTDSTAPVTLSLVVDSGQPTGELTCDSLTVAPVNGVATFDGCSIDKGGRYKLHAALGAVSAESDSFLVSGAAWVALTTQPSGGAGGVAWLGQPVASVLDGDGAVITTSTAKIGLAIKPGTGAAGTKLTCPSATNNAMNAVDGVATFTGCSIDLAGTGYQLYAVDVPDSLYTTSNAFDISAGNATALAFITQPGGGAGGGQLGVQPAVAIVDQAGNTVTSSTAAISLTVTSGTGTSGAAVTCTTNPVTASNGVAVFAGCGIDKAGSGYTLTASSSSLTSAVSSAITIQAGAASGVSFTTDPSGGAGGVPFATQPVVHVVDAGGNGAGGAVQLSIKSGTGSSGAVLTCAANPAVATGGSAQFSGCQINTSGTGYVLVATLGTFTAESDAFDVSAGAAAAARFETSPDGGLGGEAFAVQPVVELRDAGGNISAGSVTLALADGFGTPGATLACQGGNTKSAVSGLATFSGCEVDLAGAGYRLVATVSGSAATAMSTPFDVTIGAPAQLAFTTQPGGGTGGTAWVVQPVVAVQDAGGNTVVGADFDVDLAVTSGTGSGALECASDPLAVAHGLAFFTGCSIDLVGATYTLTATAASLSPAVSDSFAITIGAPAELLFSTQPSGGTAGQVLSGQPVAVVVDAGGNAVAAAGGDVAIAITTGTGTAGASLACASSTVAVDGTGTAAFGGCSIDQAGGGYALTATWSALTAESLPFAVLPATAPTLGLAPTGAPVAQTYGGRLYALNPTAVVDDVNTATGALHRVFTDLEVAGVGQDLIVERTYNSNDPTGGKFGRGFTSIFDLAVMFNAQRTLATVRGEDGQQIVFTWSAATSSWVPPAGARSTLKCTSKTCLVTRWDGTSWQVTGTQLDYYYDANGVGLRFVKNSATQTTVKVATTNTKVTLDVIVTLNANGQITKIKTPKGREVSYGYTTGRLTSLTDARGKVWTYSYDAGPRLTQITDPTGETRLAVAYDAVSGRVLTASAKGSARHTDNRYSYDLGAQTTTREAHTNVGGQLVWAPFVDTYSNNVLIRQDFPTGAVMRYSYDTRLNLVAIQDPTGFVQEMVYNATDDLIAQRTPISSTQTAVVQVTYDTVHRMLTQTDPNGNTTVYVYNGPNLASIVPPGPGSGATQLKYDGLGQLTSVISPVGVQNFTYDAAGNRAKVFETSLPGTPLNGNGSLTTYDEAGNALTYTDPRGVPQRGAVNPNFTTSWVFDNAGNLTKTTSPTGVVTTFTHDNAGDVVSSTNPGGTTTYGWSESTLTRAISTLGGSTVEVYDQSGNLLSQTSPNGGTTTYTNDELGRTVATTDPSGRTTAITYDAISNAVKIDDGAGTVVRQQFDALNRLVRRASGDEQTLYAYDLAGNIVTVQDGTGAVTQRTYDSHGNIASVTDAAGTTSYTYDQADNVVRRVDGRGGITAYAYDGMSRLTSMTVGGNTTSYLNDVAGQLVRTTDPEGRVTSLTLDGGNRTTKTVYSATGLATITVDEAYDWQDRRIAMSSGGVTSTYSYDARGNLVGAGPAGNRFSYDYSQPGKVIEIYPDGTEVTFETDDAGALMRIVGTSVDGEIEASYLRDADRRPVSLALSNGVVQTRSYDGDGNVVAQSVQQWGTVIAGETYTYDANGNRLSQRTTAAGRSVLNAYSYDATGRVNGFSATTTAVAEPVIVPATGGSTSTPPSTSPALPMPAVLDIASPQPEGTPTDPATPPAANIGYDAVGNITSRGTSAFSHGAADEIVAQTGPATSWTHDRSGAVTKMSGPGGTTTLAYDAAGRLATATVQPPTGSPVTVTYAYDGDGNRISRTVGGVTTQFTWDPIAAVPLLVLERVGGVVQRRYFQGDGGPVAMQTPTETYFFHADPLGSTSQLTDSSGAVVAAYSYDAFGVATSTGPAATATDLLFQGQQLDRVTGLYNMRARNYDPATGRFTQREPLATPAGVPLVSAYSFVGNRPTVFTDPTGLSADAESIFHTQKTEDANIANDVKLGTTALKFAVKGVAYFGGYASGGANATTKAATGLKGAGIALSIIGIGLQAYVTAENCKHGPVEKCVGSAIGLAVNVAFTVGCSFVSGGTATVLCSMAGMILSTGLEIVISEYGPEIAAAFVTFGEITGAGLIVAGNAIADGVDIAATEIVNVANIAGGAIVTGFNEATEAISSGYQAWIETLEGAGPLAEQLANVLADNFSFAFDQTVAGLLSLGHDIEGVMDALKDTFEMGALEAVDVLRDVFMAAATEVADALENVYDSTAAEVTSLLSDAGYAVDEIATAVNEIFDVTTAELAGLLADVGYGFEQIAGALSNALDLAADELAAVLKDLEYTVQQVAEVLKDIYHLADLAAAEILEFVDFAVSEVADALQDVYNDAAAVAAAVLDGVGYAIEEIADGLRVAYQTTAAQVTQIFKNLAFTATEIAGALEQAYDEVAQGAALLLKGAGFLASEVASALTGVYNQAAEGVAQILKNVNYAINEVTSALQTVFASLTAANVAGILKTVGYGITQIASALQSVYNVAADAIAAILKDLNYAIDQIAGVLQSVYGQAAAAVALILDGLGYAVDAIGSVLQSVFNQTAAAAAQILEDIGATAEQIKDVLEDTYHQAVDAIGNILSGLGFSDSIISDLGGAFSDFGDDVADFFGGLF